MSRQSKKGKTKWTPIHVEATTKKKVTTSWADEVDKEMEKTPSAFKPDSVVLPTAPRASRSSNYDESKIPSSPPYQVYLSNIPYDLTDDELADHFSELKIKSVSLPKDDRGGSSRARGFAYVVLEDRQSLIAALNRNDLVIKGRNINIELATNDNRMGGMNRGRRDGGRNELGSSQVDRTSTNWRTGPRSDEIDRSSNFDRGFSGGRREFSSSSGFRTNFDREDRGFHNREERNFDNRNFGRDRDDRRDGFFQDRDRDRGGFTRDREFDRERNFSRARDDDDRGFRRDDRANSQWRDEPRSFNRHDDRRDKDDRRDRDFGRDRYSSRREDPPAAPPASSGPQKTRPALKLLPKSENATSAANGPTPSMQAIFGGAKPVDTAAREREIEDRLAKVTPEDLNGSRPRGPSSIGSGSGRDQPKEAEPDKKRIEPAPLPKENPWGKSRSSQPPSDVVNNGRTSPDESRNNSTSHDDRGDSNKSVGRRHEPKKEESKWSKGPPANRPVANNTEKSKVVKDDRNAGKHKEPKKDVDDISKMPKVQESSAPSFVGSNKYSTLDTEEAPAE